VETIPTIEVEVSKIKPLEVEPQIKLMEEEVRTTEPKVGTKPLVFAKVKTTKIIVEKPDVNKVVDYFHFIFCHFIKILGMESIIQRG